MGIETRKTRGYYYRKVWQGGRVRSEYAGGGDAARLAYGIDLLARRRAAEARQARRAQEAAQAAQEAQARALEADVGQLAALALLATGHHQHKYVWRRRRYPPMSTDPMTDLQAQARAELARRRAAAGQLPPLPAAGDDSPAARLAILTRCNRPDASAEDIAALQALIADSPGMAALVAPLLKAIEGELDGYTTPTARELARAQLRQRRRELGYATAPAIERPLIDHLLLCELRLGAAELGRTAAQTARGVTWNDWQQVDRLLSAAQARYLRAVETLARVRRVRVELARITSPDGTHAEAVAVEGPGV